VPFSIEAQKEDRLLRLKAELGQQALDVLRAEFEKSEEGFPVPETHDFTIHLLSISELRGLFIITPSPAIMLEGIVL